MSFQFDIGTSIPPSPPLGPEAVPLLLQQLLEVQREQLQHARHFTAMQEAGNRWKVLVARWKEEFPELPDSCKEVLPQLERAYGSLIQTLVEELRDQGPDALDNDFSVQEFLDRHGMRLGQLGHILNLVGPLADAATKSPNESAGNA